MHRAQSHWPENYEKKDNVSAWISKIKLSLEKNIKGSIRLLSFFRVSKLKAPDTRLFQLQTNVNDTLMFSMVLWRKANPWIVKWTKFKN